MYKYIIISISCQYQQSIESFNLHSDLLHSPARSLHIDDIYDITKVTNNLYIINQ